MQYGEKAERPNLYRYSNECGYATCNMVFEHKNIDYFIESAPYGFLFTSCKTLENERVSAADE